MACAKISGIYYLNRCNSYNLLSIKPHAKARLLLFSLVCPHCFYSSEECLCCWVLYESDEDSNWK